MSGRFDGLSNEEGQRLIELAQKGDQSAMASLLMQYTPLVHRQSSGVFCAGAEQEDLMQEGFLGLVSAILTYDNERSVAFPAYAAICIRRSVLTAVRSASRMKHQPLNQSVSMDSGQLPELVNAVGEESPELRVIGQERLHQIERFIRKELSSFEQSVLKAYLSGSAYEKIAAELSTSPKAVDNALQRVRRKLKAFRQ
ncbi:MAG: sigma-70 family RNA polymerase sigma factor [Clostridiales bacterium]|nr:sigma-70 family RNA polymerase sigma factor [Clostridiales bacterium]